METTVKFAVCLFNLIQYFLSGATCTPYWCWSSYKQTRWLEAEGRCDDQNNGWSRGATSTNAAESQRIKEPTQKAWKQMSSVC